MSAGRLRLLPWPGPEGQPACLDTDSPHSPLSRLADRLETEQLAAGAVVLDLSRAMLDSREALTADEFAFITRRLAECLADALRVAESRGGRLDVAEESE